MSEKQTPKRRESDNHWHLDKRVPVAMIATMLLWIFSAAWWGSNLETRIVTLEELATKNQTVEARLSRIEESQQWLKEIIKRIDSRLEKMQK